MGREFIEPPGRATLRKYITTDTWHSPNYKELQAVTTQFVDEHGTLRKALLALPELQNGHAGAEVAPVLRRVLEDFGIEEKLGYITGDNHGANETMCRALEEQLYRPHDQYCRAGLLVCEQQGGGPRRHRVRRRL